MRRLKRAEQVTLRWVLDPLALLLSPEVIGLTVRLHIEKIVLVATEPQREASTLPKRLEKFFSLLWRVIECIVLGKVVGETGKAAFTELKHLLVVGSKAVLLFL
jgi:hypothetical protein